jgi:hypothetical protein
MGRRPMLSIISAALSSLYYNDTMLMVDCQYLTLINCNQQYRSRCATIRAKAGLISTKHLRWPTWSGEGIT